MNANDKATLIASFCNSVRDDILAKIENMPEEWDGFELKQLIVETFAREEMKSLMNRKRYREFKQECYKGAQSG